VTGKSMPGIQKRGDPMKTAHALLLPVLLLLIVSCAGTQPFSRAPDEFEKGLALYKAQKYEAAIPHFRKATELDAQYGEAYLYLGRSHLALHQWADAIGALRQALQLSQAEQSQEVKGDLFNALLGGAVEELKKGNYPPAIDYLKEALAIRPDSLEAAKQLGKTMLAFGSDLLSKGRLSEAIEAFREAVRLLPENLEAYIGLAEAFFKSGKIQEAIEAILRALKINPDSKEAREILMRLLQRR